MKTLNRFAVCFAALAALSSSIAFANNNSGGEEFVSDILYGSRTYLSSGETRSFPLNGSYHVKKVIVQGYSIGCDAMIEVIVNGDVKGTIHLPGRDPSYIVTVAETASSVEVRHLSGCTANLDKIIAVRSVRGGALRPIGDGNLSSGALNQVSEIASRVIELTDELESMANVGDYAAYLLPIKKRAARTYALANARGPLSERVRVSMKALEDQIDFAASYLDKTFEVDSAFQAATELLQLREQIEALLN